MKIGKKFIFTVVIIKCFSLVSLVSCASANGTSGNDYDPSLSEPVVTVDDSGFEEAAVEPEVIPPSPEELYLEKLKGISLTAASFPEKIMKGVSFTSPFTVKVLDKENNPLEGVKVIAEYPSGKKDGELVFSKSELVSNSEGLVELTADNCGFAAMTKVKFYPSDGGFETEDIQNEIQELTVSEDFVIESDLINKGAVLFIWDYNELNKPTGNSYQMISSLQKKRIYNVGNAPVNDVSDIGKSKEYLYKANYEMIEDMFGYLICGTIKFTSPVEKKGDDYEANLEANIYALDMKNGEEVFKLHSTNTATGANWNKAVGKCKEELCDRIAQELIFGL